MAFKRDDDELALMGLAICDALESKDETQAREAINKARKHAHAVLSRGKKKDKPDEPAEGETE